MGARIISVAIAEHGARFHRPSGMKLAEQAARSCLEQAERRAEELDLLINAGVYHDDNLGEPALAALIQSDIGARQSVTDRVLHGTFSFDVVNGGAGAVTALQLLDGFLSSAIKLGMLVASDAAPGPPVEPAFPFPALGGAALLAPGSSDGGFVAFQLDTYPEFEDLLKSRIVWHERRFAPGRNVLELDVRAGFEERAVECAVESSRRFLNRVGLSASAIDLVLPSQWPSGFADATAERLGIAGDRVARVSEEQSGAYTAGPLAALAAARHDGRWSESKNVLFVTVGAGINCALALYRNG